MTDPGGAEAGGGDAVDQVVARAREFATAAHARINQLRKYTRQPYDVHLRSVAALVAGAGGDAAMVAAAWLHDTVEDTPATFEDLEREFGADVAGLVGELTDVSRPGDGNRAVRKTIDRRHTAAASPRAKTIKLADVMDNCEDICGHDAEFGRVYVGEARALLAVLGDGDRGLYERAAGVIAACEEKLGLVPAVTAEPGEGGATGGAAGVPVGRRGMRLFMEAFAARDLVEPLVSFDSATVEALGPGAWPGGGRSIAGVRRDGAVSEYLLREDREGGAPPRIRGIDRRQLVPLDAPLPEVIHVLTRFDRCFVDLDGAVVGVIGRADVEKPAARMWLFGMIILVEVHVVGLIRARWPGDGWTALVSQGRLDKARQLQAERERRGLPADLLDCLQFSDKLQVALEEREFVASLGFASAGAAKKVVRDLEALRNNLAHGQGVTGHDWAQIARMARRVQELYGG